MLRPFRSLLALTTLALGATTLSAQGTTSATAPAADTAAGRHVFELVCAACHVMDPPYAVAPPMSHVARHYRQKYPTREEFMARVVSFVRTPSADSSALGAHAIERFGLMPALPLLGEQHLQAVAAYLWTLEPAAAAPTMPPARP